MTNNRKKGIRIAGALFIIILLCALGFWTYRCLNPTREQVQAAKARIEAYSCYEIRRNGKTMLRFDEDTTTLAATFMNRWALVPSCQGRLAASNNTDITRNRYQGLDADSVLVEKVDSLDSLYPVLLVYFFCKFYIYLTFFDFIFGFFYCVYDQAYEDCHGEKY